jgi:hypothetical protein
VSRYVRNRQLRRIGLTALVVVLGVAVWQGVAGATATGGKTVKIQHHNANCGRHAGSGPIGTATFSRDGSVVMVHVKLTSADPYTDYSVVLWKAVNDGCDEIEDMGGIETDGAGQAEDDFSANVGNKKQNYFVDILLDECNAPEGQPCSPQMRGDETSQEDNDSLFVRV